MSTSLANPRDERGATLILAMVFLVLGSFLIVSLATYSESSLFGVANYKTQRNLEYAADGATNAAIQALRYKVGTLPQNNCPSFPSSGPTTAINGVPIQVTCTWQPTSSSPPQWTVTFSARYCAASPCTASPLLTSSVVYYLTDSSGTPTLGKSLTVESWDVSPANH